MTFLGKLFCNRQPVPECDVDPADADMIRDTDSDWWNSLSLRDYELFQQEDNVFKIALFKKLVEGDRLDQQEAIGRVAKSFPVYYLNRADRSAGTGFTGMDAKLPYPLKKRVNAFTMSILRRQPSLLEQASSFNAMVRAMARDGRL